ncbi:hypothetical protein K4F52_003905 [Lecanicillium sp. MT-2017a]|nr:hypothetical protein K4F52_003905 [Lecanicillium sp. MT-2017a]
MSRSHLKTHAIASDIWTALSLPPAALPSLHLPSSDDTLALPSSFKIGPLAQASIGASALAAALYRTHRAGLSPESTPSVTVPLHHAAIEFKSERYHWLDDWDANPPQPFLNTLGGLHAAAGNGYVRIHDAFPNHVRGTLEILGLPPTATREDIAAKVATWDAVELETRGTQDGNVAIYALRSYDEWDALPQSSAIANQPILLRQLTPSSTPKHIASPPPNPTQCLSGLRVLELSRVIAAPIAGRTLAAHGADVLWVTSPNLPDLPVLDKDTSRGKRTIQLDLNHPADKAHLLELLRTCDVFLQSYRPGSLVAKGLSPEELSKLNPGIICANLSAFGPTGPWSTRRGFDSLVQTCTGMNVSEAQHAGKGEAARAMPCQALDHASGYLLAAGISAALYHRSVSGGSWVVDVSLAGTMKYLRSLGQYEWDSGFAATAVGELKREELPREMVEVREAGFGRMTAVRHAASVETCEVGYGEMPKPLGSDVAEWK